MLAPPYQSTLVSATSPLHYHTYAALLAVTGIRPHQVPLKRKIDAFSPQEAGAAFAASSARFPHSDDSADSDLDASR
jgi:hypothetical protein